MPRARKGAYLWLRPGRVGSDGIRRHAAWIIIDNRKHIATGCLQGETERAERELAAFIAAKYQPKRKERDIDEIAVADVLAIYDEDTRDRQANKAKFDERMVRLNEFWGGMKLGEVTGESCRRYAKKRGKPGGARRDLEDLRSAINHHAKEGLHRGIVNVHLPERGLPRDRWLTRSEAAKLLLHCWRAREVQIRHRGEDKGKALPTGKRPLRHLARFILVGLYTGTRAGAIASASPVPDEGRSFVDLDQGLFYRLAQGARATNKRQPPAPIPQRLLAHIRRWVKADAAKAARAGRPAPTHLVEWNGKAVLSVKTAFATAVDDVKLSGKVSPHTLRHTAATWHMQAGDDLWATSGYLGMSIETLTRVYGHHHPDYLKGVADSKRRRRDRAPGSESLVVRLDVERDKRRAVS